MANHRTYLGPEIACGTSCGGGGGGGVGGSGGCLYICFVLGRLKNPLDIKVRQPSRVRSKMFFLFSLRLMKESLKREVYFIDLRTHLCSHSYLRAGWQAALRTGSPCSVPWEGPDTPAHMLCLTGSQ